jgi:hypothetical protein
LFRSNQKLIVFLIAFTFVLSTFAGTVSATTCTPNPECNILAVTNDTPNNFHNNSANIHLENFKNNTSPINDLATEPTDQQFKKQKQGLKNLRTISSGGIPPKRLDEIIIDNMDRIQPIIKTAKTKINHIFVSFYKKILK